MVLEVCPELLLGWLVHCQLSVAFKRNMDDGISVARFAFDLKKPNVLPEDKVSPSVVKYILGQLN
jgi:hypothetical protein